MIWKLWSLKQQCKTCVKQFTTISKYQNIPLIEVNQFNICKLMQEGKLKTLKLQDVKAICTTIGMTTEGSQARKKSFVEPLKELVKKCTCKGSSNVY